MVGGMQSGWAAVSWLKRDGKSIPGEGSIVCKGPGVAGSRMCSTNCKRRGRSLGRRAGTARPSSQWEGVDIRLYPKGRGKPSKGFKLGERRLEVRFKSRCGEG